MLRFVRNKYIQKKISKFAQKESSYKNNKFQSKKPNQNDNDKK